MNCNQFKRSRNVIYPELKKCEDYVTDQFWKKVFGDMATGKCPKSIILFNSTISSTYKRNGFSYNFLGKDPRTITTDIVNLFKTSGCIYSLNDMKDEQIKIDNDNNAVITTVYSNWKHIKTKKLKNQYIHDFVLKQSVDYKLSDNNTRNLLKLINSALNTYKTHRSCDVIFEDNEINEIIDIEYDPELKLFVNTREVEDKEDVKKQVNLIKKTWQSYIIKNYKNSKTLLK